MYLLGRTSYPRTIQPLCCKSTSTAMCTLCHKLRVDCHHIGGDAGLREVAATLLQAIFYQCWTLEA
jgi:hypothetical protein